MKKFISLGVCLLFLLPGIAQVPKGRVVFETINAPSLQNKGGEDPVRRVTIYLPPGYDQSTSRYPVIYYLHGFTANDSMQVASAHVDELINKGIARGKTRPVIMVIPNQHTLYRGSWYTNSSLTGNWADFTAKDLVSYVDKRYRTIPDKNSRGITGHSMGGHGAIKIGMLFPDVFSSVYGLSPAVLLLAKDIGPVGSGYRQAEKITSRDELLKSFLPLATVAMGRAFSPNPAKAPFYCDLPFSYPGDSLVVDRTVLAKWNQNLPFYMIDANMDNLRKLKALKLDWGRNENFPHIPEACRMFSQKLENLGINHYAEEYIGDHGSRVWTEDGRILNDMLPFFDTYLSFDTKQGASVKR